MTTDVGCPTYTGAPAVSLVAGAWPYFQNLSQQAFDISKTLIGDLSATSITPISFSYLFTPPANPNGFVAPDPPVDPGLVYDPANWESANPGKAPATGLVTDPSWLSIPAKDYGSAPVITTVALPTQAEPTPDYGTAPDITDVTIPDAPTLVNPTLGTFLSLNLPVPIPITLPTFDAVAPGVDFQVPTGNITFVPQQYTSTELTLVQSRLSTMLAGGTGLPADIEQALYDRARSREDMLTLKAIQETKEEFASMGFEIPPGAMAYRLFETRQANQDKVSSLNRDILIKATDVEIENLRWAVQQGVALEGKLMDTYMHLQDLQMQFQRYLLDAQVSIFNANVSLFNAKQQAYAIQAQVYRDRIQAETLKLEIYKSELEAERLKVTINEQTVRVYEAQLRGVTLLIEEYKAQIEAQRLVTEVDRNRVEIFRARVGAFSEEVRAWAIGWDAYKTQIQAQATRVDLFKAQVEAYTSEVNAARAGNEILLNEGNLILRGQEIEMEGYKADIQHLSALIGAERDRISSGALVYEGQARVYGSAGQIAAAESDSNTRAFQAVVEAGRASADVALKNAELQINQLVQINNIIVESLRSAATAAAQLCASTMSAVHFGANAQDSNSTQSSVQCSTEYFFSGVITG